MDGMYTRLFEPVLKKVYPKGGITEVKSTGQKELRIIDTLEPVLGNHKLCTTPECILKDFKGVPEGDYKYACFYQLTRLTRDRGSLVHDDRLDSLAIGIQYLVDYMGIDAEEGESNITEEWLEDKLEGLYHHYTTRHFGNMIDTEYLG